MIRIHVQDNAQSGKEAEKAVGIFTGFRDKVIRMTDPDVASYGRKDASHADGGIQIRLQQDLTEHGCSGGFAMGSGYGDGKTVILHDLSQELCPGQHGKTQGNGPCVFRVVRMNGCRIDHKTGAFFNIGCALSVEDPGSFVRKSPGQRRFLTVRAGNGKSFFHKDLGESAHADPADSDKVDVNRILKLYLVHMCISSAG